MNTKEFREFLLSRKLSEEKIQASIALVERFEAYIQSMGGKPDAEMTQTFCNCSAGFSKSPWEIIFRQTLEVEVLESALQGDMRCRFAIRLPETVNQ